MLTSIVTLPSPNDFVTNVGAWSSPWFDSFWGVATFAMGIFIGAGIVVAIISWVTGLFDRD